MGWRPVGIDGDGVIKPTASPYIFGVNYDDLTFPFTRDKQGQLQKPDFDFTNLGLLFPQNDATEIVYLIGQFKHHRKAGSDISAHFHWLQTSATLPTFKMDYKWYDNGDLEPGSWTTLTQSGHLFTYTAGSLNQLTYFPTIDGSSITDVSSLILVRFYRDDNTLSGDVLVREFDIHYEIDTLGSDQLYSKTYPV